MSIFEIALVCLGTAVIVLVEFDITATVLHPEVESPLSTRFQRVTWRCLRLIDRIRPRRGGVSLVLNWSIPIMVAGLIALWLLLLSIGFALIYYPWITDDAVFASPNPLEQPVVNALYYSGVTIATLGYGDIQPIAWPLQLVSVIEAILGALAISFGVAYVLAVYPALSRRRTLAAALDAEVAGQASAIPMIRRYVSDQHIWQGELADRLRELATEILATTESHQTHPVLYYAHARRVEYSFLRILVISQNLVGLLRYGLSPDKHHELVSNPQLLLLERSLHHGLRSLSASLHIPPINELDADAERQRLTADYADICRCLEQIGFVSALRLDTHPVAVLSDGDGQDGQAASANGNGQPHNGKTQIFDPASDLHANSALDAYIAFRLETDPHLDAYANASGYALDHARADYDTEW